MKIYLASYFEPDNHGSGKHIGISPGNPPKKEAIDKACEDAGYPTYDCDLCYENLSPGDAYWEFHKEKSGDYEAAGKKFEKSYKEKLEAFFKSAAEAASAQGKSVTDILPFSDGDNLLSWEKSGNITYRDVLVPFLKEAGYEVEDN